MGVIFETGDLVSPKPKWASASIFTLRVYTKMLIYFVGRSKKIDVEIFPSNIYRWQFVFQLWWNFVSDFFSQKIGVGGAAASELNIEGWELTFDMTWKKSGLVVLVRLFSCSTTKELQSFFLKKWDHLRLSLDNWNQLNTFLFSVFGFFKKWQNYEGQYWKLCHQE